MDQTMAKEKTSPPEPSRDLAEARAVHKGRKGFLPGKSGNPKGRPKGARNKATLLAESLLEGEVEGITRKMIDEAKSGNVSAIKFCLERLLPARRGRPVQFSLPEIASAEDIIECQKSLIQSVAIGDLSPEEAIAVSGLLDSLRKGYETAELERRLAELERQQDRDNARLISA